MFCAGCVILVFQVGKMPVTAFNEQSKWDVTSADFRYKAKRIRQKYRLEDQNSSLRGAISQLKRQKATRVARAHGSKIYSWGLGCFVHRCHGTPGCQSPKWPHHISLSGLNPGRSTLPLLSLARGIWEFVSASLGGQVTGWVRRRWRPAKFSLTCALG
jgi:hypothetical protein